MPSRQLLIVSLVFACTGLRDAKSLEERVESRMGADPERPGSRGPPHRYAGSRPPQAVGQLSPWAYPKEPAAPVASMNPPMFQLRPPTTTRDNLAVRCGEDSVDVEVSQDLQGTGRLVQPDELTLGGCAATLADDSSQVLVFHSQLHGCNSKLIMTNDKLVYAFKLLYKPKYRRGVTIVRTVAAVIGVECHYSRLQMASISPF
ncbi:unnamed protein product [Arctogadus glacialis]